MHKTQIYLMTGAKLFQTDINVLSVLILSCVLAGYGICVLGAVVSNSMAPPPSLHKWLVHSDTAWVIFVLAHMYICGFLF